MKSGWKVICLSPDLLLTSKLLIVNLSKSMIKKKEFCRKIILNLFDSFRVSELLDYTAEDMTGMSLYALCHGEDVHKLKSTHEDCK